MYRDFSASHDQNERRASAPELSGLPNTPVAVYEEGARQFAEIYGSSKVQAQRWFLVSLGCIVLALAGLLTVAILLPLKTISPFVVEINPTSGVVNKPVEVVKIEPNMAVIKSELARWVEAMYTIDPMRTDELQRWAGTRSADKAVVQVREFRGRERIYERIAREPEMVREARVTAVDASQKGTAFAFVTTTERLGVAQPAPEQTHRFRVTLNYKLLTPTKEAQLYANPLGLYVTYFVDVEERAK
jgi:type IV secretion system protein TrbF